ncbi:MAG: glycine cleavage system protein GcvH [candidate division WOR-3 bacterium]|nr:MAG: glycine cleavage system protein GcvH [candidate division WOR-3 bacterium]
MEIEGYNMPEDLYYNKDDSWAKVESDGTVRVGMDDFYQKQAGDTTYVDLPFEGDSVSQGETCGKIQSSKWVGKLVSPISGEIVEVNGDLESDCRLINKDPYGSGWIMRVKPSKLDEELKNLIYGADALKKFIDDNIKKAKGGG